MLLYQQRILADKSSGGRNAGRASLVGNRLGFNLLLLLLRWSRFIADIFSLNRIWSIFITFDMLLFLWLLRDRFFSLLFGASTISFLSGILCFNKHGLLWNSLIVINFDIFVVGRGSRSSRLLPLLSLVYVSLLGLDLPEPLDDSMDIISDVLQAIAAIDTHLSCQLACVGVQGIHVHHLLDRLVLLPLCVCDRWLRHHLLEDLLARFGQPHVATSHRTRRRLLHRRGVERVILWQEVQRAGRWVTARCRQW